MATRAVGRDVYSLVRDPHSLDRIKGLVSSWQTKDQVNLGRKMVITEIEAGKRRNLRIFNYMDLHFHLNGICLEAEPWFEDGVYYLNSLHKIRWASADDFYYQIAAGLVSLPQVIGSFYAAYSAL